MNAKQTKTTLSTVALQDLAVTQAEHVIGGVRHEVTREEWERIVAQMIKDANKR